MIQAKIFGMYKMISIFCQNFLSHSAEKLRRVIFGCFAKIVPPSKALYEKKSWSTIKKEELIDSKPGKASYEKSHCNSQALFILESAD